MSSKKIKVGILFGGRSCEHEVSIESAQNVYRAIDRKKYQPVLIKISQNGVWNLCSSFENVSINTLELSSLRNLVDVVFPVLHGPYGEDGTIQGFLKTQNIPFVGSDVLGSAIGMDKDVSKRLLKEAEIPVARFITAKKIYGKKIFFDDIQKNLGLPFFVKPANLGSSVGVSKVHNKKEFMASVKSAFLYDAKIIFEEYIDGREIECAVLGNENLKVSIAGEVIPSHEFYSYTAKYLDKNGARLAIPAKITSEQMKQIQKMAIKAFEVLGGCDLARVDFFLKQDGAIYLNEINTIPGFTKISMYPKLWKASGIDYTTLISKLIGFALVRYKKNSKLKTTYTD